MLATPPTNIVRVLLKACADPNIGRSTRNGQDALQTVINSGDSTLASYLIKRGAKETPYIHCDGSTIMRLEGLHGAQIHPAMRAVIDRQRCSHCGTIAKTLTCGGCSTPSISYCTHECQRADWEAGHKAACLEATCFERTG